MTAPKGYVSGSKLDRTNAQFSTVEQVRLDQYGLSVLSHQFVAFIASLSVTSATVNTITTNNHGALQGDVIRFTSGVNSGREVKVYSVTTNVIMLAEDLATAPSAADTYSVLRHKYPLVDSTGILQVNAAITAPPIEYKLNGITTTVAEDTITSANNRPLPVQLQDSSGNLNTVTVGSSVLPTGAATETTLSGMSGKLPATLGQKVMTSSMAVSIASDQSAIPASQSGTWNITNISGTVSLPTGAATAAKQPALGIAGTASSDVITVQGIASMTALKVDGSAVTQPISAASLPLPTGAALDTSVTSMSVKLPATLGQHTMAASMSVAFASDQSAIPASQSGTWSVRTQDGSGNALTSQVEGANRGLHTLPLGYSAITFVRNDYSVTNVTTSAYVQLVASLSSDCQEMDIFDSGGNTLYLATGAAASEVNQIVIPPGGNGRIRLRIASGTRVSVKAVATSSTSGELNINFYG